MNKTHESLTMGVLSYNMVSPPYVMLEIFFANPKRNRDERKWFECGFFQCFVLSISFLFPLIFIAIWVSKFENWTCIKNWKLSIIVWFVCVCVCMGAADHSSECDFKWNSRWVCLICETRYFISISWYTDTHIHRQSTRWSSYFQLTFLNFTQTFFSLSLQ